MWSLGCLAVALYLGTLLYTGHNEYDMASVTQIVGFFFVSGFIGFLTMSTLLSFKICLKSVENVPVLTQP